LIAGLGKERSLLKEKWTNQTNFSLAFWTLLAAQRNVQIDSDEKKSKRIPSIFNDESTE
jgi:hypothetical protein